MNRRHFLAAVSSTFSAGQQCIPTLYRFSGHEPLAKVLGVEFTAAGVRLAPGLTIETYRFDSPLFGRAKSSSGYEGWYGPSHPRAWTIEITLPERRIGKAPAVETLLAVIGHRHDS